MKDNARNNFSNVAEAYAKYRRDYIDRVYEEIYTFCPNKESSVLDIGCGTGFVANHLASHYSQVIGVDKSAEMLEVAKVSAPSNASFAVALAEKLPFEDATFDLVTAGAAYHWFDFDKAGTEILRVLKPAGKLCVFWKYAPGEFSGYLPKFIVSNLEKFVPNTPSTNNESISEDIFRRVGFSKVDDEEFDFADVYTEEEFLGYIQSHSTFNLLTDTQKVEYMRLCKADISTHLTNGKFIFPSRMEMWFVEK
jgi:ubiquinone/menaquinone biosynthesis C-methylase UbiE